MVTLSCGDWGYQTRGWKVSIGETTIGQGAYPQLCLFHIPWHDIIPSLDSLDVTIAPALHHQKICLPHEPVETQESASATFKTMPVDHGSGAHRPYEESDLKGMKKLELLSLVKAQIKHWPLCGKQKKLQQDKVMKHRLLEVLLNPRYGFSTTTPRKTRTGTTQTEPQCMLSGNHASIPNPALAQNLDTTMHQCEICLHIHDQRSVQGILKTLEVFHTHAINHPHLHGKWQVSACNILQQLQKTNGQIMGPGPVKLGVPDDNDREPEYTQYFVQAPISELTSTHPEYIYTLQRSELLNHFKPLECARDRTKAKKKAKVDEDDVEWLKASARKRFGHEDFQCFQCHCHRVLQNLEIVALWKFAAQFCSAYHTKKSGGSYDWQYHYENAHLCGA
ncbi:hypothetical protein L208DRAFT_1374597 [Tricholoma matsutake]|nr:hypothetical protein L208DRAFT_1374597 [Tricholoma matsutake 945]